MLYHAYIVIDAGGNFRMASNPRLQTTILPRVPHTDLRLMEV